MVDSPSYIYLASRSLRRRELLHQIRVEHEPLMLRVNPPRTPDVNENPLAGELPSDYVTRICRAKVQAGWDRMVERKLPHKAVLAADTTVCLGDQIFGTPINAEEARITLRRLSGRQHRVLTAVALKFEKELEVTLSESTVRFRYIEKEELERYVDSGEPLGKAGAYAIQGRAAIFISEMHGSYSGVVGLPLYETAAMLKKFGAM